MLRTILIFLTFAIALNIAVAGLGYWSSPDKQPPIEYSENAKEEKTYTKYTKYLSAFSSSFKLGWAEIGEVLHSYHDEINAVSTVVIAIFTVILGSFTVSLSRSTRIAAEASKIAAEHVPRVERAYISGGGGEIYDGRREGGSIRDFHLDVNNYGKTPGELLFVRYVFLEIGAEFPIDPPYVPFVFHFHDWIEPGIPSRHIGGLPLGDQQAPAVIFGRFFYRDIFKKSHSCGFVLEMVDATGATRPLRGNQAPLIYTEERDEPVENTDLPRLPEAPR